MTIIIVDDDDDDDIPNYDLLMLRKIKTSLFCSYRLRRRIKV